MPGHFRRFRTIALIPLVALIGGCPGTPSNTMDSGLDTATGIDTIVAIDTTPLDTGAEDAADSASTGDTATAPDVAPDAGELPPPMICRTGSAWTAARPAFSVGDTTAWGLADVRGTNLGVADLDNDGYPDLLAMTARANQRTTFDATPPTFHTRVLLNRPRTGGGRTFVDVTQSSNFLATRESPSITGRQVTFVALADVDNDGDVDAWSAVYTTWVVTPEDLGDRSTIMLNDGSGNFTLGPQGPASPPFYEGMPQTLGAAFTDQDRDGLIDLFVGYSYDMLAGIEIGQQHQLFRGVGGGQFEDATTARGLALSDQMQDFATSGHRRALYGVAACDLNDDGRQDLLGMAYGRQRNLLFLNDGDRSRETGIASGVAGDANQDYTQDQSYRCYCTLNAGACPSGTPAPIYVCDSMNMIRGWTPGYNDQPWRLNGNTFSMACGDVDNDGDTDLYTAEIAHPDTGPASDRSELLVNDGSATFTRPGRTATGLVPGSAADEDEGGLGSTMWDFDMDGRLDLYLAASDYPGQFSWLFHQNANGTFTEVGTPAGFHHACPHGHALADFDLDGDVDIIVGSSTARDCGRVWTMGSELRVYENVAGEINWTAIRLVGSGVGGANRSAIGARVRVTSGGVTQTREIQGAFGQSGQGQDLVAHFGLGSNCAIDRVEVRWPDANGTIESFTDVRANYRLEIRQGENRVRYVMSP